MSSARNKAKNRRSRLIVLKDLQSRIIRQVTIFPTIALALAAVIVTYFCRKLVAEAASVEAILPSLNPLLLTALTFVGTMGVVVFYQALRFSNRLAGPAYRLGKSLERIRQGDFDFTVKLRDGDFLTELADDLNVTISWLRENAAVREDAVLESLESDDSNAQGESEDEVEVEADADATLGSPVGASGSRSPGGKESGALLIELLMGVMILTMILGATIPVCLQHSRLRELDDELYLALSACRNNLEDIRTVDFLKIPSMNGTGFDVPSVNGSPRGLQPVPGDLDGLPGMFTVIQDQGSSGEYLYEVIANVTWTGTLGRQNFQMSSLFAERKAK